ncbi:hypothetical protein [Pseudomonas sp. GWSMS-1]|uniref:hypothetical protein n=1 Tax=Pseudomonas sp. GWSMS-1 TaxID=3308997 RepID=UPI003CF15B8B
MDGHASDHHTAELDALRRVLIAYGQSIIHDWEGIAVALSFDQLADHLSINPIHRKQARIEGDETLQGLAFIARLEDSADRQSEARGEGMTDFIRACLEHLLADPFAPGEVFGPKLPPVLHVM